MLKTLLLFILIGFSSLKLVAQDDEVFTPEEKFSADSIKSWTKGLFLEISEAHPGMYRYTSKNEFDSLINSMILTVNDSLTTLEFYRKVKPLFAKIGCLHTAINMSDSADDYYAELLKFIPVEVFVNENRQVYITKNYDSNNEIPLKSEILSINDQPISEILDVLYLAIPSDGYNQTLKTLLLNYRFPFWYQSMVANTDQFTVETKLNGQTKSYRLDGVSEEVFPTMKERMKGDEEQLRFEIQDNIGFLTIRSFAKSNIRENDQKFDKFIKQAFKELSETQTENLVIDLRNNTGGTDGNAAFLTSHFFDQPFKYWEHPVEMTEGISDDFKFWLSIFYKMPKQVDTTYQWNGARSWLSKEFSYYKIQKPAKNNFTGKVYIITNGGCMSSCADVVAILSANQKAIVIGQETGGGYQGNTSGMMPSANIYGNLRITIPLQKYTNAVDPKVNVGRGTIPDYVIVPTLENWMSKKDLEMELVKKMIGSE
ncbi:MAG: S41 family peptidase [Ekhidna sp.]